jgi:hypothetical protein
MRKNIKKDIVNNITPICKQNIKKCNISSTALFTELENSVDISDDFGGISCQKQKKTFFCDACIFSCEKESNWNMHLKTKKHMRNTTNTEKTYVCNHCSKEYKKYTSYWSHFKKCQNTISSNDIDTISLKNIDSKIIKSILLENRELQKMIIEQYKENSELVKVISNSNGQLLEQNNKLIEMQKVAASNMAISNCNNTNSNNKFNLNIFLHEKCKDAVNLSEFIESIEVSREDLENNAQLGFVQGISKILLDNLKQLSLYERPIHCTDIKRETMYIHDDNKWQKDDNATKINGAIQQISSKSVKTLMEWKETNPDYQDIDSDFSHKCISMQQESLAGYNRDLYYPKIVHSLAKETAVDKSFENNNNIICNSIEKNK